MSTCFKDKCLCVRFSCSLCARPVNRVLFRKHLDLYSFVTDSDKYNFYIIRWAFISSETYGEHKERLGFQRHPIIFNTSTVISSY
jgi:hypothetical protein